MVVAIAPVAFGRGTPEQTPAQRRNPVDVIASSYTLTERDKTMWSFSWRMSLRNQERTPVRVRAQMEFRDARGKVLDYGRQTITIEASSVAEVSGVARIKAGDAQLVTSATPSVALLADR